jgi:DNA-binding CsgD family transcriptional regulator
MSTGPRYGAQVMERARRPATPEEAKALAHPLRQRIVRLCGIRERTNKELADQLERDPATVLHHVRQLVATGFLEPCEERVGPSGAREKPYRSTGMSWRLELDRHPDATTVMMDATRDELAAAGSDAVLTSARLVVRLPDDEIAALVRRIREVVEDAHDRSARLEDDTHPPYGLLALVHRFADGSPAVGEAAAPDHLVDGAPEDAGGEPEAHGA